MQRRKLGVRIALPQQVLAVCNKLRFSAHFAVLDLPGAPMTPFLGLLADTPVGGAVESTPCRYRPGVETSVTNEEGLVRRCCSQSELKGVIFALRLRGRNEDACVQPMQQTGAFCTPLEYALRRDHGLKSLGRDIAQLSSPSGRYGSGAALILRRRRLV